MKIVDAWEVRSQAFEVEDDECQQYTRLGLGNWRVRMGESDEPVYDEEKIKELDFMYLQYLDSRDDL